MTRPRILVVEHQASCPPARLGDWLVEAGCDLDVRRPYLGDPLPDGPGALTDHQGLLVLGGSMDSWDPDVAWLEPTRALVRQASAQGVPTLGVCLGHQLLALALGGEVARSPHGQRVGLGTVGWTDPPDGMPEAGRAPETAVFWNDDVVLRVPESATVLARHADGDVQAVRWTPTTWGVQWHPEATVELLEEWAAGDADRHLERGIDATARIAEVRAAMPALERTGRALAALLAGQAHARLAPTSRTEGPG